MLQELLDQLIESLPQIAQFLGIVGGGLLGSWIAARLTRWFVRRARLDALAEKAGVSRLLYAVGVRRGVDYVLSSFVWIGGLLLTAVASADFLGLDAFVVAASAAITFLPKALAAAVLFIGGMALASTLRGILERFGRNREDVEQPQVLGAIAYYGTLVLTAIVAAGQAGLETALVESLMITLAGIVALAIAMAFALGSRESFHNLVAGHFFRRIARPGDRIEFGATKGVVIRYFGVCVVLETETGEITVPCKVVLNEQIRLQRLGAKARAQGAGHPETSQPAPE